MKPCDGMPDTAGELSEKAHAMALDIVASMTEGRGVHMDARIAAGALAEVLINVIGVSSATSGTEVAKKILDASLRYIRHDGTAAILKGATDGFLEEMRGLKC